MTLQSVNKCRLRKPGRLLRNPGVLTIVAIFFFPLSTFAKRLAPKPVPPVVWNGVEYRTRDMNFVEAINVASKQRLWRTKVYFVWYMPLTETDVQDIFITSLSVQNGKLLVTNEAGKSYWLNLNTGHVEGAARYWLPWYAAAVLLLCAFLVWRGRDRNIEKTAFAL
jgi:hypothetical protein